MMYSIGFSSGIAKVICDLTSYTLLSYKWHACRLSKAKLGKANEHISDICKVCDSNLGGIVTVMHVS